DPKSISDMLRPWLQRAANQRVSEKGKLGSFDWFSNYVRRTSALQMMALNVTQTLGMLHGVTLSALRVRPTSLLSGLWSYVQAPLETAASISERSPFMRAMIDEGAHEAQKTIDDILFDRNRFTKGLDFVQKHAYFLQHAMHTVTKNVTW